MNKKMLSLVLMAAALTTVSSAQASEVPDIRGRCGFVSQRPLMLLLKRRIYAAYEAQSYTRIGVILRVKPAKTSSITLSDQNLTGISAVTAGGGGAPLKTSISGSNVELGCTLNVNLEVVVKATNAQGAVIQDTHTSTISVKGIYR